MNRWLVRLWLPLAVVAAWWVATRFHWLDSLFFPSPGRLLDACWQLTRSGELARHLGVTLLRLLSAFLLGSVTGAVAGLLLGSLPFWRNSVQGVLSGLYSTPKLALLPAFLVLFGLNDVTRMLPAAIGCFILMAVYSMDAVRAIKPGHVELARSCGAGRRALFLRVYVPACLPNLLTGLRLGLGSALVMIVATEMLGGSTGLGAFIWMTAQVLALDRMYVGIAACTLVGVGSNYLFELIEKRVAPWMP